MDIKKVLEANEVLKGFDEAALNRLIQDSFEEEYSAGQAIVSHGQHMNFVGILVSGGADVFIDSDKESAPFGSIEVGQLFGEISLLTGEPAMADIIARTSIRVIHIPQKSLTREMGLNPLAAMGLARLLKEHLLMREERPDEQSAMARARAASARRDDSTTEAVLVINVGSSSVKYAVFSGKERLAGGLVERIGQGDAFVQHRGPAGNLEQPLGGDNHEAALKKILGLITAPEYGALDRLEQLTAVGHRVVHGGVRFSESTLIDDNVISEIARVSDLAPLHNPVNLLGIEICQRILPPGVPQVAVFDTAFHSTIPEHVHRYAIPRDLADENQLRRFGFHGTSHKYVAHTAAAFLGEATNSLKIISCHLGNGASVTAIDHGRSVDTSMGLTPLEGLIMGTRPGDLDPGLILHLFSKGKSTGEVETMLNKESGLKGLSGLSSDMRELEKAADAGHTGALLAIQSFCYRVRKYVGAYMASMCGLDVLVFTAGIGENSAGIRSRICHGLSCLGIEIDDDRNRHPISRGEGVAAKIISTEESRVVVMVVPTDEESAIAVETLHTLSRVGVSDILTARRDRQVPIGISAHHVHLCKEHVEALFGPGHKLTPRNELTQKGYFACEETVNLIGPKGRVERVRILGPERPASQVEISRTEEFKLGIDAPVRASGDVKNSPGVILEGPTVTITLKEGVICAYRHIHMAPEDALAFGIRDKDVVRVKVEGERSLIFGDVLVRVYPGWSLEMHIDTDEANAAEVSPGMTATIESIQKRA